MIPKHPYELTQKNQECCSIPGRVWIILLNIRLKTKQLTESDYSRINAECNLNQTNPNV